MTDESGDEDREGREPPSQQGAHSADTIPPEEHIENADELEDDSVPSAGSDSIRTGPPRTLNADIVEEANPTGGIASPQLSEERRELRQMQADRDRRTDAVRGRIGIFLLLMLAFSIAAPWISIWKDPDYFDSAKELFPLITTPLVGLIGAAMGFYFGERSTGSPPASGDA